ncbi:MAG: hypothetical protein Q7S33_05635 [Nanoarchaeota archaeon]|nr:hypothetical protein [Nanoarchaeota archaeon]
MKKLEDIRRTLNESRIGRVYNEIEPIHKIGLPFACAIIGVGTGYVLNQTASNFDQVIEAIKFFNEHSYLFSG